MSLSIRYTLCKNLWELSHHVARNVREYLWLIYRAVSLSRRLQTTRMINVFGKTYWIEHIAHGVSLPRSIDADVRKFFIYISFGVNNIFFLRSLPLGAYKLLDPHSSVYRQCRHGSGTNKSECSAPYPPLSRHATVTATVSGSLYGNELLLGTRPRDPVIARYFYKIKLWFIISFL